jgi:histone deacetylase 1/2
VELLQQLQNLQGAPSVQMQQVPPLFQVQKDSSHNDEQNPDERPKNKTRNGDGDRKSHETEFYDKVD